MFIAGRIAFNSLENFNRNHPPATTRLWIARLSSYYDQQGSWKGVDTLISGYPCGSGWDPWDQDWQMDYILAASDGAIVASSDSERLGRPLTSLELAWAISIDKDGRQIGFLVLPPFDFSERKSSGTPAYALQRFLLAGLMIGGGSLIVGMFLSRRIGRPLLSLTEATRVVATGDLSVRVPTHYPGEMGELAVAFNAMAEGLDRADELRRNMTADVAHELRTPLSVIRGKLEGVLDGVYPATQEHLEPVLEETEVLTHLVEDLRLLALAEA